MPPEVQVSTEDGIHQFRHVRVARMHLVDDQQTARQRGGSEMRPFHLQSSE